MASCPHPASSLKPDSAEQANGTVTVRFCCNACLAPITKQFMLATPEPAQPAATIGDLLAAADGTPTPAKVRGANSPWRRHSAI